MQELHREPAGHRVRDVGVAGAARIRPGLAEAGDRAHHDLRIEFFAIVPAKPEPLHDARRERFDDDVGFGDEIARDRKALRLGEVEAQPLLAAVVRDIHRGARQLAPVADAGDVAVRKALDLDHLGAMVGEVAPARRPRDQCGEFDDADPVERPLALVVGHGVFLLSR